MSLYFSHTLERLLPQSLVEATEREIEQSDTRMLFFSNETRFYSWCKTKCSIGFLVQHVLHNENIPFKVRCSITSYLLSKKCGNARMTPDERDKIQRIYEEQKEIRTEEIRKRGRETQKLKRDSSRDKRIRLSMHVSSSKEMNVVMYAQVLSTDVIAHCFSFLEFYSAWNLRSVCRGFFRAYTMCKPYVYIHKLSDTVLFPTLRKIVCYCADSTVYPNRIEALDILQNFREKYFKAMQFKESGRVRLMRDRLCAMIKSCIPLLKFLDDRVVVYSIPMDVSPGGIVMTSTIARSLYTQGIDIQKRCAGISIKLENQYDGIYFVRFLDDVIKSMEYMSWIHIQCPLWNFMYMLVNMDSLNIHVPKIYSLYIDVIHDQYSLTTIVNPIIMEHYIRKIFPQLKSLTFMNVDGYTDIIPSNIPGIKIERTPSFDPSTRYNPTFLDINQNLIVDSSIDEGTDTPIEHLQHIDIDTFFNEDTN